MRACIKNFAIISRTEKKQIEEKKYFVVNKSFLTAVFALWCILFILTFFVTVLIVFGQAENATEQAKRQIEQAKRGILLLFFYYIYCPILIVSIIFFSMMRRFSYSKKIKKIKKKCLIRKSLAATYISFFILFPLFIYLEIVFICYIFVLVGFIFSVIFFSTMAHSFRKRKKIPKDYLNQKQKIKTEDDKGAEEKKKDDEENDE